MGKKGIFEYVNLQSDSYTSNKGNLVHIIIAVSDTPNEIRKDSPVGEKLHSLGFWWSNKQRYEIYKNRMTQQKLDAIKEINVELEGGDNQTGDIDTFQDMLESLRAQIAASEIPVRTKDELDTNLENFIKKIADATGEEAEAIFNRYIDFTTGFHDYSDANKVLIYLQKPDATKVASKHKWRKMGRQVINLQDTITINCGNNWYIDTSGRRPVEREYTLDQQKFDDQYDYDVANGRRRANPARERANTMRRQQSKPTTFDPCAVYAYENTTGSDLPAEQQGEWTGTVNTNNDNSAVANTIFEIAKMSLRANGITVTQDPSTAGEAGWSRRGQYNVSQDVTGTYAVSTIVKEWAGDLLHQAGGKFYDKTQEYLQAKGTATPAELQQIKKVQESTVAAAVSNHFGLPTDEHPTYMALLKAQGGLDSKQLIDENVTTISAVSSYIVREIKKYEQTLNRVAAEANPPEQAEQ